MLCALLDFNKPGSLCVINRAGKFSFALLFCPFSSSLSWVGLGEEYQCLLGKQCFKNPCRLRLTPICVYRFRLVRMATRVAKVKLYGQNLTVPIGTCEASYIPIDLDV